MNNTRTRFAFHGEGGRKFGWIELRTDHVDMPRDTIKVHAVKIDEHGAHEHTDMLYKYADVLDEKSNDTTNVAYAPMHFIFGHNFHAGFQIKMNSWDTRMALRVPDDAKCDPNGDVFKLRDHAIAMVREAMALNQ